MITKDKELTCFTSFTCAHRRNTASVFLRFRGDLYVTSAATSAIFRSQRRCRSVGGQAGKYTKIILKMASHVIYVYTTVVQECSWRDEVFKSLKIKVSRVRMYSYSDPGIIYLCLDVCYWCSASVTSYEHYCVVTEAPLSAP